jgi:hypothetical protein
MFRVVALVIAAAFLATCATPYGEQGLLGGFSAIELRADVWRVKFQGNGYTTRETAQTYWLNRCAELTLEKGYNAFEILSDMQFVLRRPPGLAERTAPRDTILPASRMSILTWPGKLVEAATWHADGGRIALQWSDADAPHLKVAAVAARGAPIFIYSGGGYAAPRPGLEGDIHMIKRPIAAAPPKIFDAKALKAALEPHMSSEKCGTGNVCPHVHEYLLPIGKLR